MMQTLSMACKRLGAMLVLGICATSASAANCWTEAGREHGIDPLLLYSIAKVESALNPKALNRNSNGTYDVGLMQVNSIHLPRLKQVGITHERLVKEPCTSVRTGAAILADFIKRYGYTWKAVGAYNAGGADNREEARKRYVAKVWKEYRQLSGQRAGTTPNGKAVQPSAK
ncbi:transglycosylase SLT domain-containing protein [Paraherbaspirillum soli]|uniref:Transglycosylase SLT domain-containing protein n=1 Tax=Paraherbaspirillum soli TaxID=631222 RepID=A0ABW0MFS9_9BURK